MVLGSQADSMQNLTVTIRDTQILYVSIPALDYSTLVIGIPGKATTPSQFLIALQTATTNGDCSNSVKIIGPDFGQTAYNHLGSALIGNLELNDILDAFVNAFANSDTKVVIAGYSKGGQAVERYSLVHSISQQSHFLVGCGSSYTFLNDSIDYIYGLRNFPSRFQAHNVHNRVRNNNYHITCGSIDFGSDDNSTMAMDQGVNRLERAENLHRHLSSQGATSSLSIINGAAHNYSLVMPHTGEYICNGWKSKSVETEINGYDLFNTCSIPTEKRYTHASTETQVLNIDMNVVNISTETFQPHGYS